jgi:predicted nuclease with TOPRIM domain
MLERRRDLLKRTGANVSDMTRIALANRPEDPRTQQLRNELSDLRRQTERVSLERERTINELREKLRIAECENSRYLSSSKDITELNLEAGQLREQLHLREKEILALRQENKELTRREAQNKQVLMTRIAQLESPSIGTVSSLATNQTREANLVKFPKWMQFGKRS